MNIRASAKLASLDQPQLEKRLCQSTYLMPITLVSLRWHREVREGGSEDGGDGDGDGKEGIEGGGEGIEEV